VFWKTARERYAGVTADDPDVRVFLERSADFQNEAYSGLGAWIQDLGHRWVAGRTGPGRALEIGFGAGRHSRFFSGNIADHFVSDYTAVHISSAAWRAALGRCVRCDARRLPFAAGTFNTVISIYNLEHIADLQAVLREVRRVLAVGGRFLVAMPCEGGLAWNLGRELTTRRLFQKRYQINYDKVIAFEHVWDFEGVEAQLHESRLFDVRRRAFFPFGLPSSHLNLIACLELSPCSDRAPRS
jgi:SAM-dependent methyltransferase